MKVKKHVVVGSVRCTDTPEPYLNREPLYRNQNPDLVIFCGGLPQETAWRRRSDLMRGFVLSRSVVSVLGAFESFLYDTFYLPAHAEIRTDIPARGKRALPSSASP